MRGEHSTGESSCFLTIHSPVVQRSHSLVRVPRSGARELERVNECGNISPRSTSQFDRSSSGPHFCRKEISSFVVPTNNNRQAKLSAAPVPKAKTWRHIRIPYRAFVVC